MPGHGDPEKAGQREEVSEKGDRRTRVDAVELVPIVGYEKADIKSQHRPDQLDDRLTERVDVEWSARSSKYSR